MSTDPTGDNSRQGDSLNNNIDANQMKPQIVRNHVSSSTLPAHHTKHGFTNPWKTYKHFGFSDMFRLMREMDLKSAKPTEQPSVNMNWSAIQRPIDNVQMTWLGHASFLIQVDGVNFLTDPVFSDRCSPVQWAGPKRYTPPPCKIQDLPALDFVLISHNHYDHLDYKTIHAILEKSKHDIRNVDTPLQWIAPLKVGSILRSMGVDKANIMELDWWDHVTLDHMIPSSIGHSHRLSELEQTTVTEDVTESIGQGNNDNTTGIHSSHLDQLSEVTNEDASQSISGSYSHKHTNETDEQRNSRRMNSRLNYLETQPTNLSPRIIAVPAQHQTNRGIFDRMKSLWCGFVIIGRSGRVYFTGDTGYRVASREIQPLSQEEDQLPKCPIFKEIGNRYGPIDLCCLPIGAYSPRWFMSSVHASPEDAVDMFLDVRAKRAVGMHWGTWVLTDEPVTEPPQRLSNALAHKGIPQDLFVAVKHGATISSKGRIMRDLLISPEEDPMSGKSTTDTTSDE